MAGSIRTFGTQHAGVGRRLLAAGFGAFLATACTLGGSRLPPPAADGTLPPVILVPADTTVFDIARNYGLPPRELVALNGLAPPFTITEGQVLRLPSTAVVPPGVVAPQTATGSPTISQPLAPAPTPGPSASPRSVEVVPLAPQFPSSPPSGPTAPMAEATAGPVPLRPAPVQPVSPQPVSPQPVEIPVPAAEAATAAPQPPAATAPADAAGIPVPPQPGPDPSAIPSVEAGEPPPGVVAAPPPSVVAAPPVVAAPSVEADVAPRPVVPPARSGAGFAWPVEGELVAGFGSDVSGDRSDGIRIAAPRGTPVRASDNGTVAYAGNEVRGYGNLVLVRHEGDWITAYAHLDSILVAREEVLTAGQPLGTVGNTGAVASPVLHFEIREGTNAVDPVGLLPPR